METSEGSEESGSSTGAPEADCTMMLGDVVEDTTIPAGCVVEVPLTVHVSMGATLTVMEGATLRFGPAAALLVGVNHPCGDDDCTGGLVIQGTPDQPVLLTSAAAAAGAGDWVGVRFGRWASAGTTVEHAIVEFAGAEDGGAIELNDNVAMPSARVAVDHTTTRDNAGPGLLVDIGENKEELVSLPFFASLADNDFADTGEVSVLLDVNVVGDIAVGNTFGAPIGVEETWWNFGVEATWANHGVPYRLLDTLEISDDEGAVLELAPGNVVEMPQGREIVVGALFSPGALRATDVTFRSASQSPAPGDWHGIRFSMYTAPSFLEGCTVAHARGDGADANDGVISMSQGHTEDIAPIVDITDTTFVDSAGTLNIFAETAQEGPEICAKYLDAANVFDLLPCD